jgi:hypothetical protein
VQAPKWLKRMVESVGGTVESVDGPLLDETFSATLNFPLPADHWLTQHPNAKSPAPFCMGIRDRASIVVKRAGRPQGSTLTRDEFAEALRSAARYAIKSTIGDKDQDFSPDAMVEQFVIGVLGYPTETGQPVA